MPATEWTRHGDFEDIRLRDGRRASRSSPSAGPRCATPSVRRRSSSSREPSTRRHDDAEVGVIILTGEGPDAFCSGGDQRVRGDDGYLGDDAVARRGIGRLNVLDLQIQIRRLPKPVVAMVAGYAIGGGHVLHLVCDLTIAADNARFGQTGPKVGSFDGGYGAEPARPDHRTQAGKGGLVPLPRVRRGDRGRLGLGQRGGAARRPRGRDRGLVPPDALAVTDRTRAC